MNKYSSQQKRALVTGASGYVGSNLVRHLISKGWEVHVIIREDTNIQLLETVKDSIKIHEHDGTISAMIRIVAAANPDIVYHLASLFLVRHSSDDIAHLINSNITFSTQLLEAMVKNGSLYLVNTSTSWQHYNNENFNPVNLYAATKQAFENIIYYYTQSYYLKVINLVLFDTYGPGDNRNKLISLLCNSTNQSKPLQMSPGEQMIDIVYIDDVVRAFEIAGFEVNKQSEAFTRYGISSGTPIRLNELVKIFNQISKSDLQINFGALPYRNREVMTTWTNYQILPNWKPVISLDIGLMSTLNSTKQNAKSN